MPETGTVKLFNAQEGKRFGFLTLASGEELFFHFNDGQFIEAGGSSPSFSGKATIMRNGKNFRLRDPQIDDKLVFQRSRGRDGRHRACPWGFYSHWETAEERLAKRPIYRVLKTMSSTGRDPGEPEILWEGSDVSEAIRRFPLPTGRQSPSADPLLSYYSDSDNIFEVRHWWEKKGQNDPEDAWERCDDPRPLPGVLRTFEAINRR